MSPRPVVKANRVYTFLPIGQHDKSQYVAAPANTSAYSLAAVYAMIARATGITRDVATLKNVRIDRFWNNTKKIAVWRGSATTLATLGTFKAIGAKARLNNANVIGEMKIGRLVILRGTYTRSNGAKGRALDAGRALRRIGQRAQCRHRQRSPGPACR